MKKITVWNRLGENGWNHNHIEDGWVEGSKPKAKKAEFKRQISGWKNNLWRKSYEYLTVDNKVIWWNGENK